MSWNPCPEPKCPNAVKLNSIETLIVPRAKDLGGFEVRRVLPSSSRQLVGPFIFFDRGAYVVEGAAFLGSDAYEAGRMMVFRPGDTVELTAGPQGARLMLLGGETLDGPRYLWWNFVASSPERIEAAKQAWAEGDGEHGRFTLPPGDTEEFIPLPD